jgi:hypothetical protein
LVSTGLSTDFDRKYYTKNSPITGSDDDGLRGRGPEHKAEMLAIATRMGYKPSGQIGRHLVHLTSGKAYSPSMAHL